MAKRYFLIRTGNDNRKRLGTSEKKEHQMSKNKKVEIEEQNKLKGNRRREIKIKAEINAIKNKSTIQKINETKIEYFLRNQ